MWLKCISELLSDLGEGLGRVSEPGPTERDMDDYEWMMNGWGMDWEDGGDLEDGGRGIGTGNFRWSGTTNSNR